MGDVLSNPEGAFGVYNVYSLLYSLKMQGCTFSLLYKIDVLSFAFNVCIFAVNLFEINTIKNMNMIKKRSACSLLFCFRV